MEVVKASTKVTSMGASTKASMKVTFTKAPMEVTSTKASTKDSMEVTSTNAFMDSKVSTKARPHIFRFQFPGSKQQLPRKVGSSAASTKASTKVFRECFRSSFHKKLEAMSTKFYISLPWKLSVAFTEYQRLPRQLSRIYLHCTLLCLQ